MTSYIQNKMMRIRFILIFGALVVIIQSNLCGQGHTTVELTATLSRSVLPDVGINEKRKAIIFVTEQDILVRSSDNDVELRDTEPLADMGFLELGNEGTNSYFLHAYPRNSREQKSYNRSFVRHFRGRLPNLSDGPLGAAALPWSLRMTCPPGDIRFKATPFAPPTPRFTDLGYTLEASSNRRDHAASDWVTNYIDYRDEYVYIENGGTIVKKSYPHGNFNLTNSHFAIISFTNFNGVTLPSRWRVVRHWLDPDKRQDFLDEIEITVNSVIGLGASRPRRAWPPPTWVGDNRFIGANGNLISYTYATTNALRSEESVLADQDFKDQQAHALLTAEKRLFKPGMFAILLLLVFAPLAIMFWSSNKKHEANN
jgi:hypothetical protein